MTDKKVMTKAEKEARVVEGTTIHPLPRSRFKDGIFPSHQECDVCGVVYPLSSFYQDNRKWGQYIYYRRQCKKCLIKRRKQRNESTPENFIARMYTQLKSKRRNSGTAFTITLDNVLDMYKVQEGKCAITGIVMTHTRERNKGKGFHGNDTVISLDRIDANGPYRLRNIRLVCKRVNLMRGKQTTPDFVRWCEAVADPDFNNCHGEPTTGILSYCSQKLSSLWDFLKGVANGN